MTIMTICVLLHSHSREPRAGNTRRPERPWHHGCDQDHGDECAPEQCFEFLCAWLAAFGSRIADMNEQDSYDHSHAVLHSPETAHTVLHDLTPCCQQFVIAFHEVQGKANQELQIG